MKFGLVVIGDEILSGRRRDTHVDWFRQLLRQQGTYAALGADTS